MRNGRVAPVISFMLVSLLSPLSLLSPALAKETGEDRPVGTLGGAVHADPFTGVATTSIPIEVPPGRNGMQPNLALTYNSANGNGWLGVGWELAQEGIYRQTKWGVDYNNNTGEKAFVVKMAGVTGELVPSPPPAPSNQWSAKIEGGFSRIEKLTAGDGQIMWKVTTKQGRKHYFGQTGASRQVDPADASRIFGWLLDRVEDPDGNYMTYSYWTDTANNQVYLDRIEYAGNMVGGNIPSNVVIFYRDDGSRVDQADMYTTSYRTKTKYRLKTIEFKSNSSPARAYKVQYANSINTSRSLPIDITQFGSNAILDAWGNITNESTGAAKLVVTRMTWSQGVSGFGSAFGTGLPGWGPSSGFTDGNVYPVVTGDWNGDGRHDFARVHYNGVSFFTANSNGNWNSWGAGISGWGPSSGFTDGNTYPVLTGDWNGDGRTDFGRVHHGGVTFFTSDGNGNWAQWGPGLSGWGPGNGFTDGNVYPVLTGDWNGDGRTDFGRVHHWGITFFTVDVNGNWTQWGTGLSGWGPGNGFTDGNVYPLFTGDWNGDGRVDFGRVQYDRVSFFVADTNGNWSAWGPGLLGWGPSSGFTNGNVYPLFTGDWNGDGRVDFGRVQYDRVSFFVADTNGNWSAWGPGLLGWGPGNGFTDGSVYPLFTGDWNGDGRTDFGRVQGGGVTFLVADAAGTWSSWGNTLLGWGPGGGFSNGTTYPIVVGDWNGDGRTDFGRVQYSTVTFFGEGSLSPDLAKVIETGFGGATTITYDTSANDANNRVPFALQRVKSISTCDHWNSTTSICAGTSSTTNYAYSGGFYHLGERDLRGVAQVTVTGPADATGQRTITETYFHQGSKANAIGETLAELQADTKAYTKGQPYRVVVKDQTGTVQSETLTEYYDDVLDGTTQAAPFFTPVKDVVTKLYAGGPVSKETKVAYTYGESSQYGHVTREDHYGDATNSNAVTSDDKTVVRTYGNNTTDYLIGFPTSEIVYAGIGTTNRVAQTDFYYDGTTSCSTASTNQVPTKGHLTRSVRHFFNGTSPHGNPETRLAYDSFGNKICTRDARSHTTTITYDSTGTFPLSTTTPSPASLTTTTAYYGVNGVPMDTGLYGQVKSVTDPNGRITSHEYDALGRKTKTTNPDGFYATVTYNYGNGQTVGTQHALTTNSLGHSTAAYFDGLGRTTRKTSTYPGGPTRETKTEYDLRGQVLRTSLPYFTGGTIYWRTPSYDALGRVMQLTNPDTTVSRSCYADWTTVTVEADGDRKRETKDAFGRVVKIEEYSATVSTCDTAVGTPYATTIYQYDVLGNLLSVTDAKGNVSTMAYDSLGRKISMHDPDMGDWSYQYDENGNLTKQTDAKGQVLWFQYDELNRRRQKDYTTQKTLGSGDVKYTYDDTVTTANRKGRLKQVQDAATDVTFEYDVLGRIAKSTKVLDGTSYVTTSLYDGLGRLTSVSYPSTPAKSVDYVYVGPYLEQVKDKPGDGTVTYVQYAGWNEMGQPATATYNVGTNQVVVTTYTYQTADNATCLSKHTFRPCTTKTQKGTNPAYLDLRYVFTSGGNIHDIFDQLTSANSQSFDYDALDRLTLANGPYGAGGANSTITYSYDEIGNLTANTQMGTYGYPASGPTSVRPHAVATAGPNSYIYDANGNLTSGAGRTYTWNLENKPLTITQGGQTTTFVYDGDGGRVKKIVGTTTTRYISKLYECDNTNCTRFIYAGNARVATIASNGAIHFWHPDHLGSSTVITDSTGAKAQVLTYYPYGATRTNQSFTTPAVDVPYKYTGKELDSSTGLYYYEARYYDPELGRFISADTLVAHTRDPQDLNRYAYARNSPVMYTDPTGHFFKKVFKALAKPFTEGIKIAKEIWHKPLNIISPMHYYGYQLRLMAASPGIQLSGLGRIADAGVREYQRIQDSRTGRYIDAGIIVTASAVATFYCGGCGATATIPYLGLSAGAVAKGAYIGATIGSAAGVYGAARTGEDPFKAALLGGFTGAVGGGLSGGIGHLGGAESFGWNLLGGVVGGTVKGAGEAILEGHPIGRGALIGAVGGLGGTVYEVFGEAAGGLISEAGERFGQVMAGSVTEGIGFELNDEKQEPHGYGGHGESHTKEAMDVTPQHE